VKFRWFVMVACMASLYVGQVCAADAPAAPASEKKTAIAEPNIEDAVYVKKRKLPINVLYKSVLLAFENNGYFVTSEPNIGKSMQSIAQRLGKDYNRNKLEEIKSMVLSNPWFANKMANADPYLLAMFPISVTLVQKGEFTTILFVRPSKVASVSKRGLAVADEMEKDVIRIFENIL